jgi:hypothetical protein
MGNLDSSEPAVRTSGTLEGNQLISLREISSAMLADEDRTVS